MSWQLWVRSAETVLDSSRILSSPEIISLIKRVNPTRLYLSETEREHGYQLKNRLQNLLLENYGEAFHLAPHPYSPDIVLIKHNALPSIDACHAVLNALSARALDTVGDLAPSPPALPARSEAKVKSAKAEGTCTPKSAIENAVLLLEQYDYPQAEEILAAIRITDADDLQFLIKAARLLMEEIGAYQRAIEVLLAQPRQLLKDRAVREILAQSYYGNGMIPEARALFDTTHAADLGKSALYAYADICFKDGNLSQAFHLLKLSEAKEGFVTAHAGLRTEIEAAVLEEARPYLRQAEEAFVRGELAQSQSLLQQALFLYPDFQEARRLAGEIEAQELSAELAMLWARFERSETASDRLELLAQLLEKDKGNAEKIRGLVARERDRQKREAVEDRLQTLQLLAAQESWEACFGILLWLSRQADEDGYRRACSVSPFFALLYHNKKMPRLEEGRELWLRFMTLKWPGPQEQVEGRWHVLQELKPYFHSYPLFKEEYDRVAGQEREKARQEVGQLFERLLRLEEQGGNENVICVAQGLVAQLRKRSGVLPLDEASLYKKLAQAALHRLGPERQEEESDYREYQLLGNLAKAAKYRESHNQPLLQDKLKEIDEEIAEMFAISVEPIALTVAPDLVVDLATEPASSGLEYLCSTYRHVLFRESDESIVVVNMCHLTATRHRSPRFKDLRVLSMLPDRDVFLFLDEGTSTLWRATLSETQSRFTAGFQSHYLLAPEGAHINQLHMSSTKDNVYYVFSTDGDRQQVVKQSLDLVSTAENTFEVNGDLQGVYRLSYHPDRFVVVTEDTTSVLESNLTTPRGCSMVGATQTLNCLAINETRARIYCLSDGVVNVLNPNLRAVKQYLKAESVAYLSFTSLANVCVETSTALVNAPGRSMFYNMETDKFSQKFAKGRVLHTETPSRWYYMEFDMAKPEIMIKDISDEVASLLEWQPFLSGTEEEGAGIRFVERIDDPEYFSIVKPVNRLDDETVFPGGSCCT